MNKLILFFVFTSSGCSTITNGTTQRIDLKDGCKVVSESLIEDGVTYVKRSNKQLLINCNENLIKHEATLTKEAITSIMLIDFGIIDFLTGAAWEYKIK